MSPLLTPGPVSVSISLEPTYSALMLIGSLHDPENGTLPLFKIRKSLKKALNEDFLASVQMEATALPDIEMVFLRIATTKRSKNGEKDKLRLLKTAPTYLVYFAGENYFYSACSNPDETHCEVII